MKLKILLCLTLLLNINSQPAFSAPLDDCRIPAAKWSNVSLGFPLSPDRLALRETPNILVIPYYFKGQERFNLTASDKIIFSETAVNIKNLSKGKSVINFSYNSPIQLNMTSQELDEIKNNVQSTWAKDFDKSTWGFVSKVIKDFDFTINYSGIDAVILYGFGKNMGVVIGEAMSFRSDNQKLLNNPLKLDGSSWFNPILTAEKPIANVSLMYNLKSSYVVTHELLHLYGLTDLYGSQTGPDKLTTMMGTSIDLLTYEKWYLGWHNSNQVFCESGASANTLLKFELNYQMSDQLAIIRISDETAFIVETSKGKYLSFYKLEMENRPPLTFYTRDMSGVAAYVISSDSAVGKIARSDSLNMFVSSKTDSSITVYVYPNTLSNSSEVSALISETNSAVELKAKQDAEAAKILAEANAAAAAKKTTITCVKGKLTKKVTAIKPVCPKGYKKK
jgi:hypothetical protein